MVVPHLADQFFGGDRLHAGGLGGKPLARTRLTAKRLAPLLHSTMHDARMRARAEDAAVLLRAEDGPARAAALIEQALLAHRSAR